MKLKAADTRKRDMGVLIKKYERLLNENKKLKNDIEIYDDVLEYIVRGIESAINNWEKQIE